MKTAGHKSMRSNGRHYFQGVLAALACAALACAASACTLSCASASTPYPERAVTIVSALAPAALSTSRPGSSRSAWRRSWESRSSSRTCPPRDRRSRSGRWRVPNRTATRSCSPALASRRPGALSEPEYRRDQRVVPDLRDRRHARSCCLSTNPSPATTFLRSLPT